MERKHVDVVRRDRRRPHDPVLVVRLLDDGSHDTRRPDAVAPTDQRLLRSVLVEERRAERRRVAVVELEDVADLDRSLEAQSAAAHRAPCRPLVASRMSAKRGS